MNVSANELRLLNEFQRNFPLVARPYQAIAERLGISEDEVIAAFAGLAARGAVSRIGAVVRPNSVGASTLAAMRVPPQRLDEVAAMVSSRPEVNHNYEREHTINLWFVVTADNRDEVLGVLDDIAAETGIEPMDLPLVTPFHIDLGFDLRC
jgi:DNA-binding Lrp family transcriptional regulator